MFSLHKVINPVGTGLIRNLSRLSIAKPCASNNLSALLQLPILQASQTDCLKTQIQHDQLKFKAKVHSSYSVNTKLQNVFLYSNNEHNKQSIYEIPPAFDKQEYEMPTQQTVVDIDDELERTSIIESPCAGNQSPMEAGKSDLKWRRRAMRRHKLLRWRKRNQQLVQKQYVKRMTIRREKLNEQLKDSWEMHGLKKEPPRLTIEEKKRLVREWREEGLWEDPLTVEEYKSYAKLTGIMKATDKKQ